MNNANVLPGASGTVKLAKPAGAAPAAKKAEPKPEKKTVEKKAAPKKAAATVCIVIKSSSPCC
jgi:hypothetical protein